MKHKVSELEGALLDAAVTLAIGGKSRISKGPSGDPLNLARQPELWMEERPFCPSTDWEDGGPIIERERIELMFGAEGQTGLWSAYWSPRADRAYSRDLRQSGATALIAAMRAYVASKFGEEIDL